MELEQATRLPRVPTVSPRMRTSAATRWPCASPRPRRWRSPRSRAGATATSQGPARAVRGCEVPRACGDLQDGATGGLGFGVRSTWHYTNAGRDSLETTKNALPTILMKHPGDSGVVRRPNFAIPWTARGSAGSRSPRPRSTSSRSTACQLATRSSGRESPGVPSASSGISEVPSRECPRCVRSVITESGCFRARSEVFNVLQGAFASAESGAS